MFEEGQHLNSKIPKLFHNNQSTDAMQVCDASKLASVMWIAKHDHMAAEAGCLILQVSICNVDW